MVYYIYIYIMNIYLVNGTREVASRTEFDRNPDRNPGMVLDYGRMKGWPALKPVNLQANFHVCTTKRGDSINLRSAQVDAMMQVKAGNCSGSGRLFHNTGSDQPGQSAEDWVENGVDDQEEERRGHYFPKSSPSGEGKITLNL